MNILLADGDVRARERLQAKLQKQGHDVVSVGDGQSALEHLSGVDEPWIALIDSTLPKRDGASVCRKIRASGQHHSVYIIVRSEDCRSDEVVSALDAGADDCLSKTCHKDVLKARLRLAERALQSRYALAERATHDPLTALPNRAFMIDRLAESVTEAKRNPQYGFVLLLINIDRFKVINESLGHASGNTLMKKIARRLLHTVRTRVSVPAGDDRRERPRERRDVVARLDGDEFVVLLEQMDGMEEGKTVANRVNDALRKGFNIDGNEVILSASIGIVSSHGETTDAAEILRAVQVALEKARAQGRARYEIATAGKKSDDVSPLKLESDLRYALDRGELEVHYQPIMDLAKVQISRFEALLRWRHPQHGAIPPSIFIPLAEETGLIHPLGTAVLRSACRQMHEWNKRFLVPTSICINISPRQFIQASFVQQVQEALKESGLDATSLELEVTENLTMSDVSRTAQVLEELVSVGVSVSLDDFGTRYSSLSYLLKLPIQTLKIDRSFVSKIEDSAESISIVKTIVALGHSLGMKVTAEGIETEAQLALLQDLRCDFGQGYLFSPALDAKRATEMLLRSKPHMADASNSASRSQSGQEPLAAMWDDIPMPERLV